MDYRLERWVNGPAGAHPALDGAMVRAAQWGEALFIIIVVAWFAIGWARGRAREREGALTALVGAGAALLVNQVILHLWARPRPFVAHPAVVHLLLSHSSDPGFPSDHASAGFAVAAVLVAFHRRFGALALLVAACVCYARVYAGIHYPADVIAGAAIGVAVALVLRVWLDNLMPTIRGFVDRIIVGLRLPLPAERAPLSTRRQGR